MPTTRSIVRVGAGVAALATVAATTSTVSAHARYRSLHHDAHAVTVNTAYADVDPAAPTLHLKLTNTATLGLPATLAPGWHLLVLTDNTKNGRDLDVIKVHAGAKYGVKQFKADLKKANGDNPHTSATAILHIMKNAQAEGGIAAPKVYGALHQKFYVNFQAGRDYIFDNSPDNEGPENATLVHVSGAPTTLKAPKYTATVATHEYDFNVQGLKRGTHLVRFRSTGAQAHIVFMLKVPDGTTKQNVSDALNDPNGNLPGRPVLGVTVMTHGGSTVVPVTLGPGTYAMICFMPELQAGPMQGAPHFLKGMIRIVTIA